MSDAQIAAQGYLASQIASESVAIRDAKREGTGDWHEIARREHKLAEDCTALVDGLIGPGGFKSRIVFYWQDKRDDAG